MQNMSLWIKINITAEGVRLYELMNFILLMKLKRKQCYIAILSPRA